MAGKEQERQARRSAEDLAYSFCTCETDCDKSRLSSSWSFSYKHIGQCAGAHGSRIGGK